MIPHHPGGWRMGNSMVVGAIAAEISGNAAVMHVLCDLITDGMNGGYSSSDESKACMRQTDITFTDGPSVGPVFDTGYCIYSEAGYSSIVGEDTTIDVTLECDCVVRCACGEGYWSRVSTSGTLVGSITLSIGGGSRALILHSSRMSNLRSPAYAGDDDMDSYMGRLE